MRNRMILISTGIMIIALLIGCYSIKHYAYRSKAEQISFGYLILHKDTFMLTFRKCETRISDRGRYENKNGTLLFHSFYAKADTTFERYLLEKFSRDYSDRPQTSTLFIANTCLEAMSHLSISTGDNNIIIADADLRPKSSLQITFPYVKGQKLSVKYNDFSYQYNIKEMMVLENRCDTTSIRAPLFSSGTVKGKEVTLSGCELLNSKVFRLTK